MSTHLIGPNTLVSLNSDQARECRRRASSGRRQPHRVAPVVEPLERHDAPGGIPLAAAVTPAVPNREQHVEIRASSVFEEAKRKPPPAAPRLPDSAYVHMATAEERALASQFADLTNVRFNNQTAINELEKGFSAQSVPVSNTEAGYFPVYAYPTEGSKYYTGAVIVFLVQASFNASDRFPVQAIVSETGAISITVGPKGSNPDTEFGPPPGLFDFQ